MGDGDVDLQGVQVSAELQATLVARGDPGDCAPGQGQQGGLAVGATVVEVQAGGAARVQAAGELQRLALCLLPEAQLCTGCGTNNTALRF